MRTPSLLLPLLFAVTALAQEPIKSAAPPSGETLPAEASPAGPRVLLIGGGSSHDFEKFFHQADSATLKEAHCTAAYSANLEESVAQMEHADVLVISTNQPAFGTPTFQEALKKFADAGKGLVLLHPGLWYNWAPATRYNAQYAGGGARGHNALGPFTVTVKMADSPITKGVPATFEVTDELYHVTLDPAAKTEVLATAANAAKPDESRPSVYTVEHPKAKIVCIALGHDQRVHDLAPFKTLLANAVHWAGGSRKTIYSAA